MAVEKIQYGSPSDIAVPAGWNARLVLNEDRIDPDTKIPMSWAQFVESCKNGIKTAIVVRSVKGGKLELVSGFRRHAAASELKLTQIPYIVRELDEVQARLENIRENTSRKDLKSADLAWSLRELTKVNAAYLQHGGPSLLANEVGLSQPYVQKLLTIMSDVKPSITKAWREATVPVPVSNVYALCKVAKEKQDDEWARMLSAKGEKSIVGPDAWKETVRKASEKFGFQLGVLVRLGMITVSEDYEWRDIAEAVIKFPEAKAKLQHRQAFGKAMARGFEVGMTEPEAEEIPEEDEGEVEKKPRSRKSA